MKRHPALITVLLLILLPAAIGAQSVAPEPNGLLTLDSIFTYSTKTLGPIQWENNGSGYLALEPSATQKTIVELVRYDAQSGARTVKVRAERLKPSNAASALTIEEFVWSPDERKLLIFTNSEKVWRSNTRGDYWILDLENWNLWKLGGSTAKPSSLMFAKFSPDGSRVGYVRENNVYVEDLNARGSEIKQITTDGARYLVNGTFDWVYEEELFCRDGWRWSPDGKSIAYWQLNTEGVKEFRLINNTAGPYPEIISFPYPKAGTTNSAARVGVVSAAGGPTKWFDVPGDPRNNYLPRMEWAASSNEVVIQQLNRLQNTNTVMLGDISTGKVRTILVEKDDAWVDVSWGDLDWDKKGLARGDAEWLDGGKSFLWASERDGWRHIYLVSRDGRDIKNITPGNYDVINVEKVDQQNGWMYFEASPDDATRRYLFRVPLSGNGKMERLTPAAQPGWHAYNISPRGDIAIHFFRRSGKRQALRWCVYLSTMWCARWSTITRFRSDWRS